MIMRRNISVANSIYPVDTVDACPVCHRHSEIEFIRAEWINMGAGVQAIWRCAYAGCKQFFFCYHGKPPLVEILSVRPVKPQSSAFSDAVLSISPTFGQIFNEAEEAAQNGLLNVAGPGYRKSFEFLIKDYAKSLAPDKAGEIENKFSGAVVGAYISDARIQAVAKRCLWLGNDETHYLKKWTTHDMADLVALIKLVAHWVDIEQLSKKYVEDMPE
jgi:hypothetical protein